MSDYVSMKSIKIKNYMMSEKMLEQYRNGNLDLSSMQNIDSPLKEIYKNTYNYLGYPTEKILSSVNTLEKPRDVTGEKLQQ